MSDKTSESLNMRVSARQSALQWTTCTVVLTEPYPWEEVSALLNRGDIASVVVPADSCHIPAREILRIGVYFPETSGWVLPRHLSPELLVVGNLTISKRMAMRALAAGGRNIAGEYSGSRNLVSFLLTNTNKDVSKSPSEPATTTAPQSATQQPLAKTSTIAKRPLDLSGPPLLGPDAFDETSVLMINSALAWGGAERQLVNTMIGLHERGRTVDLVCEALNHVPDSDFFRWRLDQRGLKAQEIRKHYDACKNDVSPDLYRALVARTNMLPSPMKEMTAPYALELLARRPGVLHAWQDQTSIYAGIAASIVGVPKIVLATRNVSPVNFAYYQDHMPEAYRALLRQPNVRIINNSKAGIEDYCSWLGVDPEKFALLYNGIEFTDMKTPSPDESQAFRKQIGIAPGRKVLGSIFRLYEEKDPFLWIETAARVAHTMPDLDFVIFGVGPLREELMQRAKKLDIGERFFLPGTEKNPGLAFSLMDTFLLTSRFEGLPNVVIEAQSQGVPVITTRAGGSGEAIIDGETGWLVKERDSAKLAERIYMTLTDEDWRQNASLTSQTFAQDRFGFDRMVEETIAIYDRVPAPGPRGLH